jgi:predicted esterase
MLGLAAALDRAGVAYLAPQARGYSWYPQSFLAPQGRNEPWLSSALDLVAAVLRTVAHAGLPPRRTLLMGFSQGACLALEFVARNPAMYGGVAGLSGGLIGPPGTPRDYTGRLDGVRVFLGCSDVDPHIPLERVQETGRVMDGMGAMVTSRIYPGMGHTVNEDELDAVRALLDAVREGRP